MPQIYLRSALAAVGMLLLSAGVSRAQTIAYDTSMQTGNQNWKGNLGLDFDVNIPIVVLSLGAFDSNADGFAGFVSVAIFNRNNGAQVTPTVTLTGTAATLVNGSRFMTLASPVFLPVGHYSVVAVGFSANDPANVSTLFQFSTENSGGGLISFVGSGRYDANTTLDLPGIVPPGFPSNVFLAGTFQFGVATLAPGPTLMQSFPTPFSAGYIYLGDTTILTFQVQNSNAPLTGIGFTDTLPDGLLIATPSGLTGSCGGGTILADPGTKTISLSGASLGATSCTFSVNVVGVAGGAQINTTSTLTSNEGSPGAAASASIFVNDWRLWFFY